MFNPQGTVTPFFAGCTRLALALFALLTASMAVAQSLPERTALRVNDLADLLSPEAEARLTSELNEVARTLGTDMTLLTIDRRADYSDAADIETFATTLFNTWGLGTAENNSGILVIVARSDRDMRIELGADYPPVYNDIAENVIDNTFLPAFRDDAYARGIETGMTQTIERIAQPFARGEEVRAPEPSSDAPLIWLALGGVGAAGLGGVWLHRRRKTCPNCGNLTLEREQVTLTEATRNTTGEGRLDLSCRSCGYAKTSLFVIPMISDSDSSHASSGGGGGSSGGSSSGGGGSGSW